MRFFFLIFVGLLCCAHSPAAALEPFAHEAWDGLLKQHVHWNSAGTATTSDYAGFQRDQTELKRYLDALSAVPEKDYAQWQTNAQRAFLINAYNAYTVALILTADPDVQSIRDLGGVFSSPWKKRFFKLLGKERHLDDVEHGLLRGAARFDEPRIHFAVNCASVGCPALRPEAYVGARLDAQLQDQTQRFLSDRTRNRFEADQGVVYLSRIFDWYRGDFEKGHRGARSLTLFIAQYAEAMGMSAVQKRALVDNEYEIEFLDYDWSLNGKVQ